MGRASHRLACAFCLLGISALLTHHSSAALVTITDDGTDTTFNFSATGFVTTGLSSFGSRNAGNSYTFNGSEFITESPTTGISLWNGAIFSTSAGWSFGSASATLPTPRPDTGFYYSSRFGTVGYLNTTGGDAQWTLANTSLTDLGLAANEWIQWTNPNVSGPDSFIRVETSVVPEPTAVLALSFILLPFAFWHYFRRRRNIAEAG